METWAASLMTNFPTLVHLLEKFVPAFIALLALIITAWIQVGLAETSRNKLKLDLFEQRYKLLETLRNIASIGLSSPSGDDQYFQRMHEQYRHFQRYKLLFPRDIEKLIDDIIRDCDDLWSIDELSNDHPDWKEQVKRKLGLRKKVRQDVKLLQARVEDFIRVDWKG